MNPFSAGFVRASARAGRRAPVSNAIVSRGLCSTCRHDPSCTYQRDPKRPVFSCEEFEIEVGERVKLPGGEVVSSGPSPGADSPGELARPTDTPASTGAGDEDDFARHKGLCGNCEERRSCTFPKPEGGVWHCEEYR
jgi:hypothetical protein